MKNLTLREDDHAKEKLLDILGFCFNTLKTYGKEPEQLVAANRMFQFVLEDYPIEKITEAFKYYFKISTEMPTPADIVSIITRGNRPPLDKSVYIRISKMDGEDRTQDQWDYLHEYEEFAMTGDI